MCVDGARWVRENVLDAYPQQDLRILAIWEDIDPGCLPIRREASPEVFEILEDPRVVQLWDPESVTGRWFLLEVVPQIPSLEGKLSFQIGVVWDAFFLYGPAARWEQRPDPPRVAGSTVVEDAHLLARALADL